MKNNTEKIPADQSAIDKLSELFFSIFTNTNGKVPDWSMIHQLCIPEAIIIKKSASETTVYQLDDFIEPRKKILTNGTLTHFEEKETAATTLIIGSMAQRHSTYQKSGYLNGVYFNTFGDKFFQFILTGEGWKISSLVWEDEPA